MTLQPLPHTPPSGTPAGPAADAAADGPGHAAAFGAALAAVEGMSCMSPCAPAPLTARGS